MLAGQRGQQQQARGGLALQQAVLQRLQVGASMGMARYPEAGNTAGELLRSADAAMYQVKQAGRSTQPLLSLRPRRPVTPAPGAPTDQGPDQGPDNRPDTAPHR